MNKAIKLAIEKGGYGNLTKIEIHRINNQAITDSMSALITQDPLFWQALGKALGWSNRRLYGSQKWKGEAFKYFDLVLTGSDTEKFWKELLHD